MQEVLNEEGTVVAWFANHQFPLAKLREYTKEKLGKAKEIVKAGATRFGTNTLVGERLLELKPALQATVVDTDYVANNSSTRTRSTARRPRARGRPCALTRAQPPRSSSSTTMASGPR